MGKGRVMPIHRLLAGTAFDPDAVKAMTTAFDEIVRKLRVEDKEEVKEIIARKIIFCAALGEREPSRLCELASQELDRQRRSWRT